MDSESSKLICKSCLSNFNAEGSHFGPYIVLFSSSLILWWGLTRVFPGSYVNGLVAIVAIWSILRGVKIAMGFGRLKACPCCKSKDLVPHSSPSGELLSKDSKNFPISYDMGNRIIGVASLIGFILGLVLTFFAHANGNKFQLAARYETCIENANMIISELKSRSYDYVVRGGIGGSITYDLKMQRAEQDKKNCEYIKR